LAEAELRATAAHELDAIRALTGIDPARRPIPVSTHAIGLLGGLWVNCKAGDDGAIDLASADNHATSIRGLYAAGPHASLYHGLSALGGSRMLADLHGGQIAAMASIRFVSGGASNDVTSAVAEAEDVCRREHQERADSGFGPFHIDLEATLREAACDLLGAQQYALDDTAAEIESVGEALAACPPEVQAGPSGADDLLALNHLLLLSRAIARCVTAADSADHDGPTGRQRGTLVRWLDGQVVVTESISIGDREIVAEPAAATRDYRVPS
jgi:succinate dehydrogenase/fumarate reductase flavoprotein subunit